MFTDPSDVLAWLELDLGRQGDRLQLYCSVARFRDATMLTIQKAELLRSGTYSSSSIL